MGQKTDNCRTVRARAQLTIRAADIVAQLGGACNDGTARRSEIFSARIGREYCYHGPSVRVRERVRMRERIRR